MLVRGQMRLGRIPLDNRLQIADAGGIMLPPMPGCYHQPRFVEDLVSLVPAHVLTSLDLLQDLVLS